jgi:hypothetical protein
MATTALTIINRALRKNGVDEPDVIEQNDALEVLNDMLSYWSVDGLLVPYTIKESFTMTSSATMPRTIGSGGNFNTVRPVKIKDAYIRDSSSNDYPLDVNMSEQEYNGIVTKTTSSRPSRLWYNPAYPLGNIYMNYLPDATYTVILDSIKPLTEFALTSTSFAFPPEYKMILSYNLAVLLSPEYGSKLDTLVVQMAEQGKMTLRSNNFTYTPIAIPSGLRWNQGSSNILTGG